MRPYEIRMHRRSSCPVALLLFFQLQFFVVQAAAENSFFHAERDTIIIDGKLLIFEREIRYDTLQTEEEQPTDPTPPKLKKRISPDTWRIGFEAAPGLLIGRLGPEANQPPNLDAFIGSDVQVAGSMGLYLTGSRKIGSKGWRFHSGIGLDFLQVENTNFSDGQFSDSLFAFISDADGQVQHVDRMRFPIGSEFDTLETNLVSAPFVATWLTVPLGVTNETELSRTARLRFGAGIDTRLLINGKASDITVVTNGAPPYEVYEGGEQVNFRPLFLTPYLHAGARFQMDRKWWFTTGFRVGWVFGMIDFAQSGVHYSGAHIQALIGLEYSIGN